MDAKKSRGPSRSVLVAGAVASCAVLVGAAYFLWNETQRPKPAASAPAASALQPLFDQCEGEPSVEIVDGLTRTTCTNQTHPAFMIYQDADERAIVRAGLMVPTHGLQSLYEERKLVGLELFSLMAGAPAETFLRPEVMSQIGVSETRVVREGLVYQTSAIADIGLIFTVAPEPAPTEPTN